MFSKFRAWFVMHNRVIAGYTALVVFLGILLIGISLSLEGEDETVPNNKALLKSRMSEAPGICEAQTREDICTIRCGTVMLHFDLVLEINELIVNYTDLKINLEFGYIEFENGILPKKWLQGVNAQITQLVLGKSNLNQITEGVFGDPPFYLTHLEIWNSNMTHLEKKYFIGLDNLEELQFKFTQMYYDLIWIEEDILDVLPKLRGLYVEYCLTSEKQVANLTGGNGASLKLDTLSLEYNSLEELTDTSLKKATELVSLYLRNNNLSQISQNFISSSHLIQIFINNNNLKTLPNGIFDGLPANCKISACGNPWICDCNLFWLQKLTEGDNAPLIPDCLPMCNENISIKDYVFDCDGQTPSISTTTSSTPVTPTASSTTSIVSPTTSTTPQSSSTFPSTPVSSTTTTPMITKCENDMLHLISEDKIDSAYEQIEIIFGGALILIKFYDLVEDYPRSTAVNIFGPNEKYRLIMLHPIATCFQFSRKQTILLDLNRSTTYTLCLADLKLACFGLYVKPRYGERAWIINDQKVGLISAATGTVVAALFLLGLSTFYYIRQHPELLKGNKRVIIVRNKRTEALVMPKYYSNPNYTPPGYLTPNTPLYERINYNNYNNRGGSSSDNSDYIRTEINPPPPLPERRGQPFIIS